jgi:hypothetical protein
LLEAERPLPVHRQSPFIFLIVRLPVLTVGGGCHIGLPTHSQAPPQARRQFQQVCILKPSLLPPQHPVNQ